MATHHFGQLTVEATDAQLELILPTVAQVDAVLGQRVEPATLKFVPLDVMPRYASGAGRARGLYRDEPHVIRLADTRDYPVERTCGHELVHWLVADHFERWHRRRVAAMMRARSTGEHCEGWGDDEINGVADPYRNDVGEATAVYLSAALFGYDRPAFTRIYGWEIPSIRWSELRDIALTFAP